MTLKPIFFIFIIWNIDPLAPQNDDNKMMISSEAR